MAADAIERAARQRVRYLFAHRMRHLMLMLMTFRAEFQTRLLQVSRIRVAVSLVTLSTGVTRMRIISDHLHSFRRIMTLHTQRLLIGGQQMSLIRRVTVVAHLAGILFRCAVRFILSEMCGLRLVALSTHFLNRTFQRIAVGGLLGHVTGGAVLVFERRMFVAHDERRRVARMRVVAGRAIRVHRIKSDVPLAQPLLVPMTRLA